MMDSISNVFRPISRPDLVIFITQTAFLFVVVITSLVNLSINNGNTNLWTMVLTSCLGYMMPNPRFKVMEKGKEDPEPTSPPKEDNGVLRDFAIQRDHSA